MKLGLLAVVDGQTLEQQRAEARASAATDGVEDEEALQTSAVVRELADTVEAEVDDFLANGVVATSEVVGSVLLAGDHRVEKQLGRVQEQVRTFSGAPWLIAACTIIAIVALLGQTFCPQDVQKAFMSTSMSDFLCALHVSHSTVSFVKADFARNTLPGRSVFSTADCSSPKGR